LKVSAHAKEALIDFIGIGHLIEGLSREMTA